MNSQISPPNSSPISSAVSTAVSPPIYQPTYQPIIQSQMIPPYVQMCPISSSTSFPFISSGTFSIPADQSNQLNQSNQSNELKQIVNQLVLLNKSIRGDVEWKSNIGDCCFDLPLCCKGFCCPCILFGRQAQRLNQDSCCIKGCQCLCCCTCLMPAYRHKMRLKHKIRQGCNDCCESIFCPCCTLIQQEQEVRQEDFSEVPGPQNQMMK